MPYIPEDQKQRNPIPLPYTDDDNKPLPSYNGDKVLSSRDGQLKRCDSCLKLYYGESLHTCPTCNRNLPWNQGNSFGDYERD